MNNAPFDIGKKAEPPKTWFAIEQTRFERHSDAAFTMLESKGIKVTDNPPSFSSREKTDFCIQKQPLFLKHISEKCNSWLCPKCRKIKGHSIRDSIRSRMNFFKIPRLFTITVDRTEFQTPKAAYEYVMGKKFIARLLTKELGIKNWLWVLEIQEESGEGWPHWHILVDLSSLPGMWYNSSLKQSSPEKPIDFSGWKYIPHFFDLNKVHRLLRKWKIGRQCNLSIKKNDFSNPEHAIFYITKYLIKMPGRGYPPWILTSSGIRFFQPSRHLGSITKRLSVKKEKTEESNDFRKKRRTHLPVERISACGYRCLFIYYNRKQDRFSVAAMSYGDRESIDKFPGIVERKDFNFETLKEYSVWGFEKSSAMISYLMFWNRGKGREYIERRIGERKRFYLSQWSNSFRTVGGAAGGQLWGESAASPLKRGTERSGVTGENDGTYVRGKRICTI